jgi:predicted nucleotidyltransferase
MTGLEARQQSGTVPEPAGCIGRVSRRIFDMTTTFSSEAPPRAVDSILTILHRELQRVLGSQLHSVLLYGSRARGDAGPESDIDVLVVMRDDFDYTDMMRRTSEVVAELSLQYDVVISRAFVTRERFENEQSPFVLNVRREGVVLG